MSDYDSIIPGPLKLKGSKKLKKEGKESKKKKIKEIAVAEPDNDPKMIYEDKAKAVAIQKTKAELEFEKIKQKRSLENILTRAEKSHKQRIIEFNDHLESLTEHFDIQKVSWTK